MNRRRDSARPGQRRCCAVAAPRPAEALRGGRAGFTLLEVILSISLTVGLMVAALAFYRHVVDVREDFTGQLRTVQVTAARRMVMDRITDELRMATTYPFLGLGMSGQIMEMQFITAALPSSAAWATERTAQQPVEPEHDLRIVGYRLRIGEDESGAEVVEGLERTVQTVIAAEVVEEGEQIHSTLIAPQFKFVAFRYWDNQGGQWMEGWEGGDLPQAVEVVLGQEPLPLDLEPAEYPYGTWRRVVHLPGGSQGFGGTTIIRGLEGGR